MKWSKREDSRFCWVKSEVSVIVCMSSVSGHQWRFQWRANSLIVLFSVLFTFFPRNILPFTSFVRYDPLYDLVQVSLLPLVRLVRWSDAALFKATQCQSTNHQQLVSAKGTAVRLVTGPSSASQETTPTQLLSFDCTYRALPRATHCSPRLLDPQYQRL